MSDTATLIKKIDAFLAKTGMSPITFGRKALNDGHFVAQIRAGRRVWPETAQRVRDFIADHAKSTRTKRRNTRKATKEKGTASACA